MSEHIRRARRAERAAARALKRRGYRILARNFTCPFGELDAVALGDGVLRFVEVRMRPLGDAGPQEAVPIRKQRQLLRVARFYAGSRRLTHLPCQFDVLTVTWDERGRVQVQHFEDAFDAP